MKKKFLTLIFILTLTACGFKVVNQSELGNFKISEIATSGDKRINYVIKKKLNPYSKDNLNNIITIELKTEKQKTIKEKNINNEVTKYKLVIKAEIIYNLLGSTNKGSFDIQRSGDYKVSSQRIGTLNNEKKMSENLSDQIFKQISVQLNSIASDS